MNVDLGTFLELLCTVCCKSHNDPEMVRWRSSWNYIMVWQNCPFCHERDHRKRYEDLLMSLLVTNCSVHEGEMVQSYNYGRIKKCSHMSTAVDYYYCCFFVVFFSSSVHVCKCFGIVSPSKFWFFFGKIFWRELWDFCFCSPFTCWNV